MLTKHVFLLSLVLALLASTFILADEPGDRAKLRDTLMEREKDSWEMMKKKDVPGLRDLLADDAVLIFNDGARLSKAEFLKLTPDFTLDSYTIEGKADLVVLTPDAATLVYRITYTSAIKAEAPHKVTVLSSSTYVRRGGKWLNVFYQETASR